MDNEAIRKVLIELLEDVRDKARQDARGDNADIGSIWRDDRTSHTSSLDAAKAEEAIANVKRATATKEGARRLVNGIMVLAKIAVKTAFPS